MVRVSQTVTKVEIHSKVELLREGFRFRDGFLTPSRRR
jgi:hypothetical protein